MSGHFRFQHERTTHLSRCRVGQPCGGKYPESRHFIPLDMNFTIEPGSWSQVGCPTNLGWSLFGELVCATFLLVQTRISLLLLLRGGGDSCEQNASD